MTAQDREYLQRLRALCDTLEDKFEYTVFYGVCKRYMDFKKGASPTKNITKKELLEILVEANLMTMRKDPISKEEKLPDDRGLRKTIRELLKRGFPIITTSHEDGCFIAETEEEVDSPEKENHSRAVAILAVDKGYKMVRAFIRGCRA